MFADYKLTNNLNEKIEKSLIKICEQNHKSSGKLPSEILILHILIDIPTFTIRWNCTFLMEVLRAIRILNISAFGLPKMIV